MYTEQDITNLVARVQQLEQQAAMPKQVLLPDYGILSHNFLTRAFQSGGCILLRALSLGSQSPVSPQF